MNQLPDNQTPTLRPDPHHGIPALETLDIPLEESSAGSWRSKRELLERLELRDRLWSILTDDDEEV